MTKLEKILSDYKKGILSDSDAAKAIMKLQNKEPKISEEPKSVRREIIHNVDPCRSSGNGGYSSSCETEPKSRRVSYGCDSGSSSSSSSGCGSVSEPKPKKTAKKRNPRPSNYDGGCGSSNMSC